MNITKEWLQEKLACSAGVKWFLSQKESNAFKVIEKLISEDKLDWANWTIVRVMNYKQYVGYAVHAAEQTIAIYEKEFPDDDRPRKAIEAAKRCIENPRDENKKSAASDAYAASAAYAAAADYADYAASYAAYAASAAAYAAAADYADYAASADYAAYAAAAAKKEMKIKILRYGLQLLKEVDNE
jgi:hypothetical protein